MGEEGAVMGRVFEAMFIAAVVVAWLITGMYLGWLS